VAGDCGVVAEPSVVAAAVETDVADGRCSEGGRLQRAADDGLIDVAESGMVFAKQFQSAVVLPRGVAKFYDKGVIGEAFEQSGEMGDGFGRRVKRKGKLDQDGAKFIGVAKNVEAGANRFFVFDRSRGIVGETLPKFCGEKEGGVRCHTFDPDGGVFGAHRLIEGCIDFDGVKEFGQEGGFVKTLRAWSGVDITGPVWIGPSCGADQDVAIAVVAAGRFFLFGHLSQSLRGGIKQGRKWRGGCQMAVRGRVVCLA